MNQKYFKFLIIALAVAIIVPQVAFAAWWNPFSWGMWNRIFHFQRTEQKQEQTIKQNDKDQATTCKKENEQCGYSFGKAIGDCCGGLNCKVENNIPDAAAKCVKTSNINKADPTAGWKTYTNTNFGYQIKYPLTAQLEINSMYPNDGCVHIKYNDGMITFWGQPTTNQDALCGGFTGRGTDNISLSNQKLTVGEKDYYLRGDTNTKNDYYILDGSLPTNTPADKIVFWYSLGFNGNPKNSATPKVLKLIFSTFKFTAPHIQATDWIKYTQEQLIAMVKKEPWYAEATFFKGLENNFLILDQGTGPVPRQLIIYDLNAKKEVLFDAYSTPLDITKTSVSYWNVTNQKVTAQNCPDSVKWTQEGLGAGFEEHVLFDLVKLTKKDLGQTRCSPRQ